MAEHRKIWTIGHSTRTLEAFIEMLTSFNIEVLADVRNFPSSKRYPHFNKEAIADALMQNQIEYVHFKDLGGRRKPVMGSVNTAWRNDAFRGYADYMQTVEFKKALDDLKAIASNRSTAYMCSEAVWVELSPLTDLRPVKIRRVGGNAYHGKRKSF
jgi:uncharacterized protein (DUF488 family)